MYDAAMDRITRWVPELKDTFERAAATHGGACRGCEIDGVHVECSFSTRVRGGKAVATYANTSCLLCSETRLKALETLERRGRFAQIVRSLKSCYAWQKEHSAVYDAAMDRITRWAPELKDRFERAAAQIKVKHKLAASHEERAAGPRPRKHVMTRFSCRVTSTERKHAVA